jgi:hypothetical protein
LEPSCVSNFFVVSSCWKFKSSCFVSKMEIYLLFLLWNCGSHSQSILTFQRRVQPKVCLLIIRRKTVINFIYCLTVRFYELKVAFFSTKNPWIFINAYFARRLWRNLKDRWMIHKCGNLWLPNIPLPKITLKCFKA